MVHKGLDGPGAQPRTGRSSYVDSRPRASPAKSPREWSSSARNRQESVRILLNSATPPIFEWSRQFPAASSAITSPHTFRKRRPAVANFPPSAQGPLLAHQSRSAFTSRASANCGNESAFYKSFFPAFGYEGGSSTNFNWGAPRLLAKLTRRLFANPARASTSPASAKSLPRWNNFRRAWTPM